MIDHRLYAPATLRNRDVILDVLRSVLPTTSVVLEVASGSGEHIVHFAQNLPGLTFQPSDPSLEALLSISAWVKATRVTNVRPPVILDASEAPWPITSADAIVCINMVHIASWRATGGLVSGAAEILPDRSPLYLYGPYKRGGVHTAASNEEFDRSLRDRDPNWGGSRRVGSLRRILGAAHHRYACEQSERGVPPGPIRNRSPLVPLHAGPLDRVHPAFRYRLLPNSHLVHPREWPFPSQTRIGRGAEATSATSRLQAAA